MKTSTNDMTLDEEAVPVVVLNFSQYLGLGIVRSLGRLGIPIHLITGNNFEPGLYSRYYRSNTTWDTESSSPQATVELLLKKGKSIGKRSLLFHTTDEDASLVAEHADRLSEWYIFPHQSPALVRSLASKKEMFFLAKQYGIPTAETFFPETRNDVLSVLDQVKFPLMLKGIDGLTLERQTGKRMVIVHTKEELLEQYDAMENPEQPNLMLQEYIPGDDDLVWMFNGYFNNDSDCLFSITGKKIRQAPVYTGYTSLGICLKNDTVKELTTKFMKNTGYKGILDLGYRHDPRDGKYKVLDINPRIGATFRLFVAANGMDVARAAYLDLTGQHVPTSAIIEGRKWFVEDRDIVSSYRYYQAKKLSPLQWISSFRGVQEAAWFALDDPGPFFVMMWRMMKKITLRSIRRVRALLTFAVASPPQTTHVTAKNVISHFSK